MSLLSAIMFIGNIEFKHVRSHTGKKDFDSINNDIVDALAKNAK